MLKSAIILAKFKARASANGARRVNIDYLGGGGSDLWSNARGSFVRLFAILAPAEPKRSSSHRNLNIDKSNRYYYGGKSRARAVCFRIFTS